MTIEIRRAGFINKGAELMLRAVLAQLRARYPEARLTMAPTSAAGSQPFARLVAEGFFPKAELTRGPFFFGDLAGVLPPKLREMYGLVLDRDVRVVLDAGGFSYSDQWGAGPGLALARAAKRWARQGTEVILLPQAFGPFKTPALRRAMAQALGHVSLAFARDEASYAHLCEAAPEAREKIHRAPDFTNLLPPEAPAPERVAPLEDAIALVPNARMLDKTGAAGGAAYEALMNRVLTQLKARGAKAVVLLHEGAEDRPLGHRLAETAGIPIVTAEDPQALKGLLGAAQGVVGSRFHALVSALSQGIPSLGTGWSHKYEALFADYGVGDQLLALDCPEETLTEGLGRLLDPERNGAQRQALTARSNALKAQSAVLWDQVFERLDPVLGEAPDNTPGKRGAR